jgi:hypothetical protein
VIADRLFNWLLLASLRALLIVNILIVLESIRVAQCTGGKFLWDALC